MVAEHGKRMNTDHPEYMIDAPPAELREGHIEQTGFLYQSRFLWGAFMQSPTRNVLVVTFIAILVLICLIAYGQLAINNWTRNFWNAIAAHDLGGFMWQLGIFFMIAGGLLVLNVTQAFLNQFFKMKLREGLTNDLINQWLQPKRAYRLKLAGEIGVNPDQRLHEDARHLAESTADLSINLLQATIILFTFIHVLWRTSEGFVFKLHNFSFPLPGYMVWAVILYAGSASFLTWLVGHNLVGLNADRYAKEAELRTALMRINQNIESVTLVGGEKDEQGYLGQKVDDVLAAIWRIVLAMTRLTGITAGYGWISNVAPAIIAAPIYFGGGIDLGGLMQAVNSFNQAHNSLRWFVDNYGALADWRATMLRIATFRQALVRMDELDHTEKGGIKIARNRQDRLSFENLTIRTANGYMQFDTAVLAVARGEHVVFTCSQSVDNSILFQAIGGLWPWGGGSISLPENASVAYIPLRSYLPRASLRTVLLYPGGHTLPDDGVVAEVLAAAGLGHFGNMLDREADWDKILGESEKKCLAFVGVILKKPDWVIAEQVLDSLEVGVRKRIKGMITTYLDHAAFINITNRHGHDAFFTREVKVLFRPVPAAPPAG